MDKLQGKTYALSTFIHSTIARIRELEDEKRDASGELKTALELLIKDKTQRIQEAINTFWRETITITTIAPSYPPLFLGIP